jgi:aldose 1-epimerase
MPFEASIENQAGDTVIILRDTENGAEAEIYAFGALLNAFRLPVNGQSVNIINGFSSVKDARDNMVNGFKSAKLSPFVCRMRKGDFTFNGKRYHVNGHYLGDHVIHGLLFDQTYTVAGSYSEDDYVSVTLGLEYKATDPGYPFPYKLSVTWKLEKDNQLTATTTVSHQNNHPIPYADGWHPYFALGGSVDEWTLQFNSNLQLEYDADLLPTGKKLEDNRFEDGTLLKGIELDNSFELTGPNRFCALSSDSIKLTIEPDLSYPILQVYIPPDRNSIAIENLTGAPDNFNNGMHLLLLPPKEEKRFSTTYHAESLTG